jgi:hypothetical protein
MIPAMTSVMVQAIQIATTGMIVVRLVMLLMSRPGCRGDCGVSGIGRSGGPKGSEI